MTSISKKYILINYMTVSKYNNKYHRTFKIQPVNVTPSTYIDFN